MKRIAEECRGREDFPGGDELKSVHRVGQQKRPLMAKVLIGRLGVDGFDAHLVLESKIRQSII